MPELAAMERLIEPPPGFSAEEPRQRSLSNALPSRSSGEVALTPFFDPLLHLEDRPRSSDKTSGIVNDPNDWATEHNDPAYILNLVKRIVRVSVETVKIVKSLPALEERN